MAEQEEDNKAIAPPPSGEGSEYGFYGVLVWAAIGAIFAWRTKSGEEFLRSYWWVAVGVTILILLGLKVPAIDRWLKVLSVEARTGLIVFAVLPVILLLVTGIVLLPESYRVVAMRGLFLTVVVLLPATMYYLFIVTRKDSLLNEYIAILDRLGLMQPNRLKLHCEEGDNGSYELLLGPRLRIETYLQRFEAAYGPIGVESREEFMSTLLRAFDPDRSGDDRRLHRRSSVGFTEVFNLATAVPVILATALSALGWLMILPPVLPNSPSKIFDGLLTSLDPAAGPVGFAFLGAYFFALQTLFRRYVRRDLRASAYVSISIRTVLAVIGIWVVVQCMAVLPEGRLASVGNSIQTLSVTGFVLGVFPQVMWQFVKKFLSTVTLAKLAIPSLSSELPLSDLDGLTVWHESRFEEEEIENIANMATADLSDLMLNTRIAEAGSSTGLTRPCFTPRSDRMLGARNGMALATR